MADPDTSVPLLSAPSAESEAVASTPQTATMASRPSPESSVAGGSEAPLVTLGPQDFETQEEFHRFMISDAAYVTSTSITASAASITSTYSAASASMRRTTAVINHQHWLPQTMMGFNPRRVAVVLGYSIFLAEEECPGKSTKP